MNVQGKRGGGTARERATRATPLSMLEKAETQSHGSAGVGFGYERDAWSPAVPSRSLSVEVSLHGIGGTVIA